MWQRADVAKNAVLGFCLAAVLVLAVLGVALADSSFLFEEGPDQAATSMFWFGILFAAGCAITWIRPRGWLAASAAMVAVLLSTRMLVGGTLPGVADLAPLLAIVLPVALGESAAVVVGRRRLAR